jgi:hypothetical protein
MFTLAVHTVAPTHMSEGKSFKEFTQKSSNRIGKVTEESLKFALTEYTKIKEENIASINAMHTTLNYGLAAVALLFTAVGQSWQQNVIPILLLQFIAPLLLIFLLRTWFGEVTRMARASYFLWQFEISLNKFFSTLEDIDNFDSLGGSVFDLRRPLHWEEWVRGGNKWNRNSLMKNNYLANANIIVSLAFASLFVGDIKLYLSLSASGFTSPMVFGNADITRWLILSFAGFWNVFLCLTLYRERRKVDSTIALYATSSGK